MAKMKAMEFTDKLNLQPVIRPVPEPQAGEILIQVSAVGATRTEKLWADRRQPRCGRYSPIQGDSRARTLRHSCGVRCGSNWLQPGRCCFWLERLVRRGCYG